MIARRPSARCTRGPGPGAAAAGSAPAAAPSGARRPVEQRLVDADPELRGERVERPHRGLDLARLDLRDRAGRDVQPSRELAHAQPAGEPDGPQPRTEAVGLAGTRIGTGFHTHEYAAKCCCGRRGCARAGHASALPAALRGRGACAGTRRRPPRARPRRRRRPHELQRQPVGIREVDPAPAGQRARVDDVDVGVELHAPGLELGLGGADVVDLEADVAGAEGVVGVRPLHRRRQVAVLQELARRLAAGPEHAQAERRVRHLHAAIERLAAEPVRRLAGERQAEDVVVEVDRAVEVGRRRGPCGGCR